MEKWVPYKIVSEYFINRFKGVAELVSVTNNFDRSNLKYTSDEDVKCLSQILTQVLKNAVFNVFVIGKPFDEVHREYHRKLESKQVQLQIKFNIHATGCGRFQQKM